MPELPEVETAMRGITPFLEKQTIIECTLNAPALRYPFGESFKKQVEGSTVLSLQRRGKFILLHLNNDHTLVWHLGMSGRIRTFAEADDYIPQKHDHVVLRNAADQLIVYNDARRFGFMRIVSKAHWQDEAHFKGMGPEPLGNSFNGPALYSALKGKQTAIKVALLDQRIIAGVGNIYASEALYTSQIDPRRPAGSLSEDEADGLSAAIKHVLIRAIESGGSSLRDYQHTDGSLGYFQHQFKVYDRAGEICLACGNTITKMVQAGRSTFYCPQCQK